MKKSERHEVYKKALILIESRKEGFICNAMIISILGRPNRIREYEGDKLYNEFHEFGLFRVGDSYVWLSGMGFFSHTKEGNFIREIILDFCIEMSDQTNKKEKQLVNN